MMGKKKEESRENFGKKLDEVIRLMEKTKVNAVKSGKDYMSESVRIASYFVNSLDVCLQKLADENIADEDKMEIADNIYAVIMETSTDELERTKDEFDFWCEQDKRFNS